MRNIKLHIQYDGTGYVGFAAQTNGVSIGCLLETAILAVTGARPRLIAAGRADAGVHARGQIVNFSLTSRIAVERLPYALNAHLPPAVKVMSAAEVPMSFHARFDAKSKIYVYTIDNSPVPSPLWQRYAAFVPNELNLSLMRAAAALLEGRHDFAAFRKTGGAAKTSVRHLLHCTVWEEPLGLTGLPQLNQGRLIRLAVQADGFLYNMVRIIAGTLIEAAAGRRDLAAIEQALLTGRRRLAGRTAPARGLSLEWVFY